MDKCVCGGTPRVVFWGELWAVDCNGCPRKIFGFDDPEDAIESFYRLVKKKRNKDHVKMEGGK